MKHVTIIVAVGLVLTAALSAVPAQAQNARSFVSGQGSDSNNCTLAAPCRTFAFAITRTNAGGEILTLNPAGYGPVTIDKSISIVSSPGVGGVNLLTAGTAITINGAATDIVSLRGLTIDGLGIGTNGIVFNSGQSLTIKNCVIRHFNGDGIDFYPNASSSLFVSNSLVADNGGKGIYVQPTGSNSTVTATFNRIEANNSDSGIQVDGRYGTATINTTASESVATGNRSVAFYVLAGSAPNTLMVVRSVVANNNGYANTTGLAAYGTGAIVRVANSTVTGNAHGWSTLAGGIVESYGNNYIDGNIDWESAPPSILKK